MIDQDDKAMRLARAIASDIALYNDARVQEALVADTLFDSLAAEFEAGRDLYASRVSPQLDPQADHFWQAVVNIVVHAKGHLPTKVF